MTRKDFLRLFYPVLLVALVFIVWKYRESKKQILQQVEVSGTTMGTIGYSVKYFSPTGWNYGDQIDSLLKVWNQSLSTYIPSSEISRFNSGNSCFQFESAYFLPVLQASRDVYEKSGGAFDPTVGPLVNAWGFGPEKSMTPDSSRIDSLMAFIGFDKVRFDSEKVCKSAAGVQLDFSAIAKGYAVDVVADFLVEKGVESMLIEIGGEIVCKGRKPNGELWRTAVEDPTVAVYDRKILAVVNFTDKAVATSGNYRNYYVKDGKKYAHTIDPASGYPVFHELLSASVFAPNCMMADAYATAFMVMGLERTKEVLKTDPRLDAYLIFTTEDGSIDSFITDGIANAIERPDTSK